MAIRLETTTGELTMKKYFQVYILLILSLICACTHHPSTQVAVTHKEIKPPISIQSRDLVLQSKTGNGEGLAKPVPGHALLINNQLIFSSMGDVALGVAMAVGAIKQSLTLFENMQPLELEQTLKNALSKHSHHSQWQSLLKHYKSNNTQILLEPYCYLNGHPNAKLEVRLHMTLTQQNKILLSKQLTQISSRFALSGENSWRENQGEKVKEFATSSIPLLVEKLQELLLVTNKPAKIIDNKY